MSESESDGEILLPAVPATAIAVDVAPAAGSGWSVKPSSLYTEDAHEGGGAPAADSDASTAFGSDDETVATDVDDEDAMNVEATQLEPPVMARAADTAATPATVLLPESFAAALDPQQTGTLEASPQTRSHEMSFQTLGDRDCERSPESSREWAPATAREGGAALPPQQSFAVTQYIDALSEGSDAESEELLGAAAETVDTKASSIGSAEHPHAAAGPEVSQEGLPQTDAAGTGTGEGGEERGDGKEGERKEGGQVEKSAEVGDAEGVGVAEEPEEPEEQEEPAQPEEPEQPEQYEEPPKTKGPEAEEGAEADRGEEGKRGALQGKAREEQQGKGSEEEQSKDQEEEQGEDQEDPPGEGGGSRGREGGERKRRGKRGREASASTSPSASASPRGRKVGKRSAQLRSSVGAPRVLFTCVKADRADERDLERIGAKAVGAVGDATHVIASASAAGVFAKRTPKLMMGMCLEGVSGRVLDLEWLRASARRGFPVAEEHRSFCFASPALAAKHGRIEALRERHAERPLRGRTVVVVAGVCGRPGCPSEEDLRGIVEALGGRMASGVRAAKGADAVVIASREVCEDPPARAKATLRAARAVHSPEVLFDAAMSKELDLDAHVLRRAPEA